MTSSEGAVTYHLHMHVSSQNIGIQRCSWSSCSAALVIAVLGWEVYVTWVFATVGTSFMSPEDKEILICSARRGGFDARKPASWIEYPDEAKKWSTDPAVIETCGQRMADKVLDLIRQAGPGAVLVRHEQKRLTSELASLTLLFEAPMPGPNAARFVDGVGGVTLLAGQGTPAYFGAQINRVALERTWSHLKDKIEVVGLPDFDATHPSLFLEKGIPAATKEICARTSRIERNAGSEIVFNITGGFKATIPFMQMIALRVGGAICYLFEDSDTLLRTPPLQVRYVERGDVGMPGFNEFWKTLMQCETLPHAPLGR